MLHFLVSTVSMAAAIGSFNRIQTFLNLDEQDENTPTRESEQSDHGLLAQPLSNASRLSDSVPLSAVSSKTANSGDSGLVVTISNGTFSTPKDDVLLHDITLSIQKNTLNMVVGRIGSGKSSILKAIIRELQLKSGTLTTASPTMAYCDQTPWLENISIRDNITRQSILDEDRLRKVIHACALDEDLALFEHGDQTIVGSGGVALSGGQKQRVVSIASAPNNHISSLTIIFDRLWLVPSTRGNTLSFWMMYSADSITQHQRQFSQGC